MASKPTDAATDAAPRFTIHREHLATFTDQLEAVVDEARVHFEAEGLRAAAVDSANVAMLETTLDADAFATYEGDGETIGYPITGVRDVLDREADVDAEVAVDTDARTFDLGLGAVGFTIEYVDPDSLRQEPDLPDLDRNAEVTIDSERLRDVVAYADAIDDHLWLGFDHEEWEFVAEAEGSTDDMAARIPGGDLAGATATGDASSIFTLDYLKAAVDAIPEDTLVTMEIGEEFPMTLRWDFGPGDCGSTEYVLCPRIQSGDSR